MIQNGRRPKNLPLLNSFTMEFLTWKAHWAKKPCIIQRETYKLHLAVHYRNFKMWQCKISLLSFVVFYSSCLLFQLPYTSVVWTTLWCDKIFVFIHIAFCSGNFCGASVFLVRLKRLTEWWKDLQKDTVSRIQACLHLQVSVLTIDFSIYHTSD